MKVTAHHGRTFVVAAILGLGIIAGPAQQAPAPAAPPAAPPPPPPKWETTFSVGVSLSRGNSDNFLATAGLQTLCKGPKNEITLGVSGAYGEDHGNKNQEIIQGYGQYNRLFSERAYGGLRLDALYDGISGVDYRVKISPLFGYYLVKTPKTSLALEAGPSVVFEKLIGKDEDTFVGARFGERFEHKLTASTKIWQSLEYVPQVDRWTEKYLLAAEIGIDAGITKHLSLRAVFQDIYDSEPAPGREHNDLRLVTGVAYKF